MPLQKFIEVVSGGIGDSDKRARPDNLINHRQIIGRLGIGLLGISQISHEFEIVSHSLHDQTAFRAIVQMKDFRKHLLDQPTAEDAQSDPEAFSVGDYTVQELPFDRAQAGLMVTATEPTEGFRRQLSDPDAQPLPKDFYDFVRQISQKDNLATGTAYNRMVWEIASLAPIPYMSDTNVTKLDRNMATLATDLTGFAFRVIVDGVKLFKPIILSSPDHPVQSGELGDGEGPFHFSLCFNEIIWGENLTVRGYIHSTAGTAIHPDDLRGILIRLRHVGIAGYDKSFMNYRYAEGPRFAWLTGELFVDQGFEDALTVGRDSFDSSHPHYIEIRTWLHEQLRKQVFPTLYRSIQSRREKRDAEREQERTDSFDRSIANLAGKPITITWTDNPMATPIRVDLEKGIAAISTTADWPRGKRQRDMAQKLGIIFELVRLRPSDTSPIDTFLHLAQQLLAHR